MNFFPDGSEFTTLAINVTGVSAGTATITAQGINIAPATILVNIAGPVSVATSTLPNGSVGVNVLPATGRCRR